MNTKTNKHRAHGFADLLILGFVTATAITYVITSAFNPNVLPPASAPDGWYMQSN